MWDYCCMCWLSRNKRKAIATNKEINRMLFEQTKGKQREFRLLLLGTGESGKATIIKQMRIIYGTAFSDDEKREYATLVFQNIFEGVKAMTYAMTNLKIPYANPQNEMKKRQVYAQWFQHQDMQKVTYLKRCYVEAIHHLWADEGFKNCYKHPKASIMSFYHLLDSIKYFIDNLDRIAAEGYIPTCQDILRIRHPSTGIIEMIVDVVGQKSERRKWIHCFDNVTMLLFVASLSEYDQVPQENSNTNRMRESLALFHTTIHSVWFANSPVVLYLNKMDLLAEKIQFSELKTYFPEFEGKSRDVQDAMLFIRKLCELRTVSNETENFKYIYCHFICAMNTQCTREVFNNIKDVILTERRNEHKLA